MDNVILALPAVCWRWHPEFKGIAQVSTRGDVKTVDRWITDKNGRKRFVKGRILKPYRTKNGYLQVQLFRNGKKRHFLLHRLVAETWLDNPDNKPEVNHLDEDKTNCDVFNLSYYTRKENINFGTGIQRRAASQLNGSCSRPVQAVDPSTGKVALEFPSMREAQRNGFDSGTICNCCQDKKRTHKGYMWRYKD